MGCCRNPTTRCGDWLIHTRPARVSRRSVQVPRTTHPRAHAPARSRHTGACGDTVGAAGRGRGTTAQMRGPAPSNGKSDGRLGRHPRGCHHGGEEYSNERFCPSGTAVAIHPDTQSRRAIRLFSLERVFGATFRKLLPLGSRETIERGRRDHHRRQCHHHCPGPPPGPT